MAARSPKVFDTHAHLCSPRFDTDRKTVMQKAWQNGVGFIEVGYDESSSEDAIRLAESTAGICSVGIHPHNAEGKPHRERWNAIMGMARRSPEVVRALGEMGLDYYRDLVPKDVQMNCFREGLKLAKRLGLPVLIHQRQAEEDVLNLVEAARLDQSVVFHCFSQDEVYAKKCLDLGGYFGIGGALTYPKNAGLRQLVSKLPLNRLLLETDCPYLPPQTHRGKRNEPALVIETLETLSNCLEMDKTEVAGITTENASRVFGRLPLLEAT